MGDTLLSKSLVQSSDGSQFQDPFQVARSKFESQQELSSSPMEASSDQPPMFNPASAQEVQAYSASGLSDVLRKAGIDDRGLALNEIGRFQLIGRLKQKFGEQFQQNSQALDVLKAFNDQLNGSEDKSSMTAAVSGADRTLKAILGG
jgi:hypothetical protein